MEKFISHTGTAAVLNRVNVDTDQIIPKQFLKSIDKVGFGRHLFFDWRFLDDGSLNPDFELNRPEYRGASILIAGENFGCGSSREHAAWALLDYGFRVIIAPSFADIFYNNCFKNSMLPIVLSQSSVDDLMQKAEGASLRLTIELAQQRIRANGDDIPFSIDAYRKETLLEGLDDIARTLRHEDEIRAYEERTSS